MADKRKYHHGDLRGALVEALRELIERDGPDGFKIAEACRIAGVSTAAPYKHFADRDAMLRAVALAGMERLEARMRAAVDAHPPADARRIASLGQAYLDFATEEAGVFRLMFGLAGHHEEDEALKAVGDRAVGIVERVVADHSGLDPEGPEVALRAYALWCFVHGHCFLTLDGKAETHGPEVEGALLRLIGEAVVPART